MESDTLFFLMKQKPFPAFFLPKGKKIQPTRVITSVVRMTMQSSVRSPLKQEMKLSQ